MHIAMSDKLFKYNEGFRAELNENSSNESAEGFVNKTKIGGIRQWSGGRQADRQVGRRDTYFRLVVMRRAHSELSELLDRGAPTHTRTCVHAVFIAG